MADDPENRAESRKVSVTSSHHEHKHSFVAPSKPGRDLGIFGVFIHVVGDAINNVGVIVSAVIIWKLDSPARYYADPAVGIFIAIMIFLTAIPLTKKSGSILLQIAPGGIDVEDVKHDIEMIPGIESVHELHVWRLDQRKTVASAHIVVDDRTVKHFTEKAKIVMECLHAYGIHSATLQPESSMLKMSRMSERQRFIGVVLTDQVASWFVAVSAEG
ncbi:Cobalt uptake protein COT1 [Metarhizium anisopliae]|nr:Cobalt uptake protein COT1 [Metarhizium anisopliae]